MGREDPSESEDDHFSDASEGRRRAPRLHSQITSQSGSSSSEVAGSPLDLEGGTTTPLASKRIVSGDAGSTPSFPGASEHRSRVRRRDSSVDSEHDARYDERGATDAEEPSVDEFDEFEEGDDEAGADDFGDFDEALQPREALSGEAPRRKDLPPLLNFDTIHTLSELLSATDSQLDTLFPGSANLSSLPPLEPISDSSAIFTTERSHSLWSQLVAPPPLQPPNWIRSRIRRLFLVSLGVPVDLDEILPASKQKKLILPSINFDIENSSSSAAGPSQEGLAPKTSSSKKNRGDGQGRISTSADSDRSGGSRSRGAPAQRRRAPPAPELDLSSVRRLCATTDAALNGFTDIEMQEHVLKLKEMIVRTSEILEYWLKRKDEQMAEKEAFEGVIENLVKHARQVRK